MENGNMTPTEVAMSFIDAINSKDVERLANLMTEDHKFIDGDGSDLRLQLMRASLDD